VGLGLAGVEASSEEGGGSVLAPSSASRNSPSSSTLRVPPCASRGMRAGPDPWRGRRGKRREEGGGGREEGAAAVARGGGAVRGGRSVGLTPGRPTARDSVSGGPLDPAP
jgi:hypothetical protein